jgi:hypothetical protein
MIFLRKFRIETFLKKYRLAIWKSYARNTIERGWELGAKNTARVCSLELFPNSIVRTENEAVH